MGKDIKKLYLLYVCYIFNIYMYLLYIPVLAAKICLIYWPVNMALYRDEQCPEVMIILFTFFFFFSFKTWPLFSVSSPQELYHMPLEMYKQGSMTLR